MRHLSALVALFSATVSARNPACTSPDNPGCNALSGNCCPASTGTNLACCGAPAPGPPGPTPTPAPPTPPNPSCKAPQNPRCNSLSGDCCPASNGMYLACCDKKPGPGPAPAPTPPPCPGPTPENPYGICALPKRSDNYFLIIGDWGTPDYDGQLRSCQGRVASMMKDYVRKQSALGKKLLFIGSVGDNFYSEGVKDAGHWQSQWSNVFGVNDPASPLFGIPWLSVLGNHDYGNDDPHCACGQGCNQFNGAHRPAGTEMFWMPDYHWHYYIPGVDVEIVGLDTNALDVGNLGGDGCSHGAKLSCQVCGGLGNMQTFLNGKKAAGEAFLDQRARTTTAKTMLIMQHYDGPHGKDYKNRVEAAVAQRPAQQGATKVLSAYGHAHDQVCFGSRDHGCDVILTGGGGGWRGGGYFGFTAVHLTDDGGYQTVLESDEVRFPQHQCAFLSHNHTDDEKIVV